MAFAVTESGEKLTLKQLYFCQEYVRNNGNATQAAIVAGYSEKTAAETGSENIRKPHIIEKIDELMAQHLRVAGITPEWIKDSLKGLAAVNLQVKEDGEARDATAANKSLELLGKTMTMFTDKKELNVGGSFNISWLEPDSDDESAPDDDDQGGSSAESP